MIQSTVVRVEERLRIKIGEAKNLPPRSHASVGQRDTYCTLSLDQEEIFRTSTIEKTLSPLYCQEFHFEIPRKFRFLSIYVYDRERTVNKDKVLGKVAIKREDLHKYNGKDHWFPILNVDADSEVQGKVHIEIKQDQYIKASSNGTYSHRLIVRVLECSDLTIINGACDPYATISFCHNNKNESKRTKIKKKTVTPQFDESFCFEIPTRTSSNHVKDAVRYSKTDEDINSMSELKISLMHDSGGVFGNVFMGEVRIPLQGIDLMKGHNAWYFLQPRDVSTKIQKTELGSLRLKIYYTSDHVFSSQFYDPLRKLILKSPKCKPITSSAAYILGEIVQNKIDAAQPLVKVFMHEGKILDLIESLAEQEISKVTDPNTIFRGNTLVSKCMDEFMKLAGMHYLHQTLRSTLELILSEKKPCEIDPSKLKEGESIESNMCNLRLYIDQIFCAITNSALCCPPIMMEVFAALKQLAITFFPDNVEVRYSVVSGFVFLRFFAPAILGPKLFELSSEPVDAQVNRTLTLISKTIQSLGNLVCSKSPTQIFKEDYMAVLYKDLITEKNVETVRGFLELVSSGSLYMTSSTTPIMLKEGVMIKRAQGRKRFGIKNFKRRYFCLTTQELFYSKSKEEAPLCRILIDQILAVEKLREESFKMKNMFQVIQPTRALYIQANNCVEEKEWIDILTKVCHSNNNRLKEYHPAAYINGHWLCCKNQQENAVGCCPVTSCCVPADIKVCIDSDREIERMHTIFLSHMDSLDNLREACENHSIFHGETLQLSPHGWTCPRNVIGVTTTGFVVEDPNLVCETLVAIRVCVLQLQHDHKQHLKNFCRQTRYGSEQAPIGDDNYLMMLAQNCK